ncbi:MAG: hypothetical protein CVV02_02890 [Firmicutes bacterium HGW-Firmicutes-7]|nr:MAG: hypothetical protein CVV02_02890 [Firmicutes bacterium HGW-Firmicutes-7]
MRKRTGRGICLLIMVVFVLNFMIAPATTLGAQLFEKKNNGTEEKMKYANDRVIVKFKDNAKANDIEITKNITGTRTKKKFKSNIEVVMIEDHTSVEEVIAELQKNESVEYAEPDYWCEIAAQVDDPFYSLQWGLENDSDFDIDAEAAWDISMGSQEVIIAVIDEGVDIYHPDLSDNIWINTKEIPNDGIDNDGNGYIDDIHGWDFHNDDASVYDVGGDYHGTHVAGIIAAKGDNGIGTIGVAPNVKIMPLKFAGPSGGYVSDAIAAIEYAKKMGAKIANNSWGIGYYSEALRQSIDNYNGVFVAVAGNYALDIEQSPYYPASYECGNIISVAAVDRTGNLSSFSNYGHYSVDVVAPGNYIYSTLPGGIYEYGGGTSMAAPHVSGVAGLLLSANPSLSPIEIVDIIKESTVPYPSLEGKVATGGLINAHQALLSSGNTALFVNSSSPYYGERNVTLDKNIELSFTEEIYEDTNFTNIILKEDDHPIEIDCRISGSSLIVVATDSLHSNRTYILEVPSDAVHNENLIGLSEPYLLRFFTTDTLVPNIIGSEPLDKSKNIPVDAGITVMFDKLVADGPGMNNITINGKAIGDCGFYATAIDNLLYIWNDTVLDYNTKYKISIPKKAVIDQGGNYNEEKYTFKFVTEKDKNPPQIISTYPEINQKVPNDVIIIVNFDEKISRDKQFKNIKITTNDKKRCSLPFSSKIEGNQLILTPKKKLDNLTNYTVLIPASAVKDGAKNSLEASYSFDFSTD